MTFYTKKQGILYLESQKDEDIFEITKKKKKTIRTNCQNRYYFGVILKYICEHIGLSCSFEIMEQHKQIKEYFGLKTTTNLEVSEFKYMCEEIRARYLEHRNLYIPLPNEADLGEMEKYLY